ncbi:uncharacterized protein TNCV_2976181 [Trichonephila clavipes]|nr:uncharacterized protein TNCV_2976181 [Trichonephila clavipes]
MAALVSEYTLEFFTLLNARGKNELIEWCMKEGLIASSYECPKCNEQMGLNERTSVVLDGFEWRCRKKAELAERWTEHPQVSDESRSFFRVHTGYFSNIPKCIKAEFIASWACSQSSVVSSSQR